MPLIDMTGRIIPENRIDQLIARDSEVTAAIKAHTEAADPHAIYLTQTEGDARYSQPAAVNNSVSSAIANHISAADPHTQYFNQSRGDARYLYTGSMAENGKFLALYSWQQQLIYISVGGTVSITVANTWTNLGWTITRNSYDATNLTTYSPSASPAILHGIRNNSYQFGLINLQSGLVRFPITGTFTLNQFFIHPYYGVFEG